MSQVSKLLVNIFIFVILFVFGYRIYQRLDKPKYNIITDNGSDEYDMSNKYDIFFINPSKDSLYITGNIRDNGTSKKMTERIKSMANKKMKKITVNFDYYSVENKFLGKENILLLKDCNSKQTIDFIKEGLTLPDNLKNIYISVVSEN